MCLITETIQQQVSVSHSYWSGSVFEPLRSLTNDEQGSFGERLLYNWMRKFGFDVQWDGDTNINPDDGVYDVVYKRNGRRNRVEVKTSGRTFSNGRPAGCQHDNLYYVDECFDKVVFIDYDRDGVIFITVLAYDELVLDEQIDKNLLGVGGHTRKNNHGKAKLDFSPKTLKTGLSKGLTFEYNTHNPNEQALQDFLLYALD